MKTRVLFIEWCTTVQIQVPARLDPHTHSLLVLVVFVFVFVSMFVFMIVSFGEESSKTRVGDLVEFRFNGRERQRAICGTLIYPAPCNPD